MEVLQEDVDFLAHFGVKGMKWGVRNEADGGSNSGTDVAKSSPRSSLGAHNLRVNTEHKNELKIRAAKANVRVEELTQQMAGVRKHSQRWRELAYEQRGTTAERDKLLKQAQKPPTSGLTQTQKKVLVGAAVAAVVVGYSLALRKYGDNEGIGAAVRATKSQRTYGSTFKPNSALSAKMSPEQVLADVSKGVNPNYARRGGQMNCRRATFAYELRRRGYDVQATTSSIGYGQNETGFRNALVKGDKNLRSRESLSKFASGYTMFDTGGAGLRTPAVATDTRVPNAIRQTLKNMDSVSRSTNSPNRREIAVTMGNFRRRPAHF